MVFAATLYCRANEPIVLQFVIRFESDSVNCLLRFTIYTMKTWIDAKKNGPTEAFYWLDNIPLPLAPILAKFSMSAKFIGTPDFERN
jgi:hypothetical protein